MQERIGEIYRGTISGVTEWGLYVELDDNMCEGLVPVRDLADDFYDYDEKNYCLTGRRHHNKYTLGDKVSVQVTRADLERKQLDFALMNDDGTPLRQRENKAAGRTGGSAWSKTTRKSSGRPSGGHHGAKKRKKKL